MNRKEKINVGCFYHIYNRGTERRQVFTGEADRQRFMSDLYICNNNDIVRIDEQGRFLSEILLLDRKETLADICAYCLMPNHFHLLLYEKIPGGISKFMQKLQIAYTMYFNKKYERVGALFQGKYKAKRTDTDEYLKYIISYIHLNPIKLIDADWKEKGIKNLKKAEEFLAQYRHSSYKDFLNEIRPENKIINKNALPDYFPNQTDFQNQLPKTGLL